MNMKLISFFVLSPILFLVGILSLVFSIVFPFIARSAPAEFISWAVDEEEFDEQYYAPILKFFDSKQVAREFVSSEGVYREGPPEWDANRRPVARYLLLYPRIVDTDEKNPFFEFGRALALISALPAGPLVAGAIISVKYFCAEYVSWTPT